jgi:hypothetical protein
MFTGNGGYGSNLLLQPAAQNSGNVPFSFGELFRKAQTGAQNIGNYIQNNPERFAIMADMIGKGFAPNNPFAGVGTAFGQSSLTNKAAQTQRADQQQMLAALQQSQQAPVNIPQSRGVVPAGLPDIETLTPDGEQGGTKVSYDHTGAYTIKGNAKPVAEQGVNGSPPPAANPSPQPAAPNVGNNAGYGFGRQFMQSLPW